MLRQLPFIQYLYTCPSSEELRERFWPHQSAPHRRTVAVYPYRAGIPEPNPAFLFGGAVARAVSVSFYSGGSPTTSKSNDSVGVDQKWNRLYGDRRFPKPEAYPPIHPKHLFTHQKERVCTPAFQFQDDSRITESNDR